MLNKYVSQIPVQSERPEAQQAARQSLFFRDVSGSRSVKGFMLGQEMFSRSLTNETLVHSVLEEVGFTWIVASMRDKKINGFMVGCSCGISDVNLLAC